MYEAKIQNSLGEILTLSGKENKWYVVDITGLNPTPGTVNMTQIAGMNGALFNSARIGSKNIVVLLSLTGQVEQNRLELYEFFRVSEACRFFYKTRTRDVFIDGIVESVECGLYAKNEQLQASIVCPRDTFSGIEEKEIELSGRSIADFVFPFAINEDDPVSFSERNTTEMTEVMNGGDADAGFELQINVLATCDEIKIMNLTSGKIIDVQISHFLAGDVIYISTVSGKKSIRLFRDGEDITIFEKISDSTEFFQLVPGKNMLAYVVDSAARSDKCRVVMKFRDQYKGV